MSSDDNHQYRANAEVRSLLSEFSGTLGLVASLL
jgi:integrase